LFLDNTFWYEEERKNQVIHNEQDQTKSNIYKGLFSFFESFFISSWYQYLEPSVHNHDNYYDSDKTISPVDDIYDYCYSSVEICLGETSPTFYCDKSSERTITVESTIYWLYYESREPDHHKSYDRVEYSHLGTFDFVFCTIGCDESVKCVDSHREEEDRSECLKETKDRIDNRIYEVKRELFSDTFIVEDKSEWIRKLHDDDSDRNPDNSFFKVIELFVSIATEYESDNYDEVK